MATITATFQTISQWNAFAKANGLNSGEKALAAYIVATAGISQRKTFKRLANAARLVQYELQVFCNANGVEIPTPAKKAGYGVYVNGKLA